METDRQDVQNEYPTREYLLGMLNEYAQSILAFLENHRSLYGSAIAIRKSMELIGAYLLNHYQNLSEPVKQGETVRPMLQALKKGTDKKFIKKFVEYYDELCPRTGGLNQLFHYKCFASLNGRRTDDAEVLIRELNQSEKDSLSSDLMSLQFELQLFSKIVHDTLCSIFEGINLDEYPYLKKLYDAGMVDSLRPEDVFSYSWSSDDVNRQINDYFGQEPLSADVADKASPDPWLSWHCTTLSEHQTTANDNLNSSDTMGILIRKITERLLFRYLLKLDPATALKSISQLCGSAPILDTLIGTISARSINQDDIRFERNTLCGYARLVGFFSNQMVHWKGEDFPQNLEPADRAINDGNLQSLFTTASALINRYNQGNHVPVYAWQWISYYQNKWDTLKNELAKAIEKNEQLVKRIQRMKLLTRSLTGVILALLLAIGCFGGWQIVRRMEFVDYYADYVWQNGMPHGIFELSKEEAASCGTHYEIVTRDGMVIRVEHVNANGELVDESLSARLHRPAMLEMTYRDDEPDTIYCYDSDMNRLCALRFSLNLSGVELYNPEDSSESMYLPADVTSFNINAWYSDAWGTSAAANVMGTLSNISKVTILSASESEAMLSFADGIYSHADIGGIKGMHLRFDSYGRINSIEYVRDMQLNDSNQFKQVVVRRFIYDQANLVQVDNVLQNGQTESIVYEYDKQTGDCVREKMLSSLSEKRDRGDGVTEIEYAYQDGRITLTRYLDSEGNLTMSSKERCAVIVQRYDDHGRCVEIAYYNTNNELTPGQNGYARYERVFSEDSTVGTVSYYNTSGNLTANADGYAVSKCVSAGSTKTFTHYNARGKMVKFSENVYQWRNTYENGLIVKSEALDQNGDLMLTSEQYAICEKTYDHSGRLISTLYRDENGDKCLFESVSDNDVAVAYHRLVYSYDPKGQKCKVEYFGLDDKYIEGCAIRIFEYDSYGRMSRLSFLNGAGEYVINPDVGCAIIEYRYEQTDEGYECSAYGLDENQQPMYRIGAGIAGRKHVYDEKGNIIAEYTYDLDGSLMNSPIDGRSILRVTFNDKNQYLSWAYFDAEGAPVIELDSGYSSIVCTYDANGQRTGWTYFDTNGDPMINPMTGSAGVRREFDADGHLVLKVNLDENGNPMVNQIEGYASVKSTYDEYDREIAWTYYDENGQPMIHPDRGYASITRQFDEYDREIAWTYFDENGQPMIHPDRGYASFTRQYDEYGHAITWTYYGVNGLPMIQRDYNYATIVRTFDENGFENGWSYYDADGNPVNAYEDDMDYAYAHAECVNDEEGNRVSIIYYDVSGEKSEFIGELNEVYSEEHFYYDENGVLERTDRFNQNGKLVETVYWDEDGYVDDVIEPDNTYY